MFNYFYKADSQSTDDKRNSTCNPGTSDSGTTMFSVGRTTDGRVQVIMEVDPDRVTLTLSDSDTDLLIRLLSAARNTES
jgi:hypothetical protein